MSINYYLSNLKKKKNHTLDGFDIDCDNIEFANGFNGDAFAFT